VPKMYYHHHCPEFNALAASKFLALLSVITCQWLDMFLHCWTPVQEQCTVCGFSEPMVFTKTVWTRCAAIRHTVLAKLLYASPAWSGFCSAADNGKLDRFLNRCRKLYRCQQLNQDISKLFSLALFSSLQKNSHHVLHRLLPAKSTQPYNLRRRRHSFSLTRKPSSYDDCNFITRMLFYHIPLPFYHIYIYHIYILPMTELFLSMTAYIIVPMCGVSCARAAHFVPLIMELVAPPLVIREY